MSEGFARFKICIRYSDSNTARRTHRHNSWLAGAPLQSQRRKRNKGRIRKSIGETARMSRPSGTDQPAAQSLPGSGYARTWIKIAVAAVLIGSAVWLGRSFGHHIPALEDWVASQGAWGYVAFVVAVIVGTSIFVPDTAFAVMAGALFGVWWGTTLMTVACLLTATLNFLLGRLFFQRAVRAAA